MQLHKPDVVAKATEILDNYGIADLTMRRLARELDVSPGALYWHFANKQELLGAVADALLTPVGAVVATEDWRECIVEVASVFRDALLSHTDGAELVSGSFAAGQSTVMSALVDELSAAAGAAGLRGAQAGLAARTIVYYVLGFTVDEQSRRQWDAAGAELPGTGVLDDDADARFAFGLRLLVDGVAAHRASLAERELVAKKQPESRSSFTLGTR